MKVRCVYCRNETEYDTCTPVDQRYRYIDGVGQLCDKCFRKIFRIPSVSRQRRVRISGEEKTETNENELKQGNQS